MSRDIKKVTLHILLLLFAAAAVVPILLMFVNSFKTGSELAKNAWGIPSFWTFSNYTSLVSFNSGILVRTFFNSVFVSVVYTMLTLIVSSAMLIMSLLGLPRAMWAGIACMSVCLPFTEDCKGRAGKRGMFNIVGCILFAVLYLILPESMYPYIGMIGGIGVGYSAGYAWQTAFNTFGALSIASGLFGMTGAVVLRIGANVFSSIYTMLANKLGDKLVQHMWVRKSAEI